MADVLQRMAARSAQKPEAGLSEQDIRDDLIKKNPEKYGILQKPIGEDALNRLKELQDAQRAEYGTRREEMAQSKPGILQLLGQAAMNSRGQKGGSALASILGGYSELATGAESKQLQQEQDLRMKELSLQQVQSEAMNKIDELKRAQAEGDVKGAIKAKLDLQKLAKDNNTTLDKMLSGQLAAAVKLGDTERKDAEAKERNKRLDENDKARIAAMYRPSERERILARVEKLRKDGNPEAAERLMSDVNRMQGGASEVGRSKADRIAITDLLRSRRLDLADAVKEGLEDEAAAIRAEIATLNGQLKELTPKSDVPGGAPKPIGAAEFDAKWKTLKSGQTLVGPDGKTYTKG
jgi:hypothetical protein